MNISRLYPFNTVAYSHTETGESPVYYRSQCSVSLSVEELGEGTSNFRVWISPNVTIYSTYIPNMGTVTLWFPEVSYNCTNELIPGHILGKSTRCICFTTSEGYPRGTAQWYREHGTYPVGINGTLDLSYDFSNPEQTFSCDAVSPLGRNTGARLMEPTFVFFNSSSFEVEYTVLTANACDNNTTDNNNNNNNNSFNVNDAPLVEVRCRVSKEHVSSVPGYRIHWAHQQTFSAQAFRNMSENGDFYEVVAYFKFDVTEGENIVRCTIQPDPLITQESRDVLVDYTVPPPAPPQIALNGQTYQGVTPSNIVALPEGYAGDITCRVEEGYPAAHTTQLKCGQLSSTGAGNTASLRFTDNPIMRDMGEIVCMCTAQHLSGCYNNNTTNLNLDITYPPDVLFTQDKNQTTFNKGDSLELACSAQGNPDPTSVTLTRERTSEVLATVQASELTHSLGPLDCLDSGVYVCSGQNTRGTTTQEISIGVRCKYFSYIASTNNIHT
ncbi:hemicentin-2 [Elysia marginata]|uniref:Hemicentin-2 n=1 Tax=Elysia marginata TaxID=1093978 RepID=A0AAV4HNG4_9GAST|nr:hemicentin-2 [Elysia marginata]